MVDTDNARLILYKRWRLRDGIDVEEVTALVRDAIVPMYARLSDKVKLGLELCADGRSILAIQRWPGRSALAEAMEGADFERWWSEYQPVLGTWNEMLEFVTECEVTELIG